MRYSLLLLVTAILSAEGGLEDRVQQYWDLLLQGDKYAALEYVHPDFRNAFIKRQEPARRQLEIVSIQRPTEGEAHVRLSLEQLLPATGHFYRVELTDVWRQVDGVWYATVPELTPDLLKKLLSGGDREPVQQESTLEVWPLQLRMSFFDQPQIGRVAIRNRLAGEVRVEKIIYDETVFELLKSPETVPSGENGVITLEYIGEDIGKNRPARLEVQLEAEGEKQIFQVSILYNYLDDSTRKFLGLTPEEAEALKPGDTVRPGLDVPVPTEIPEELKEKLKQLKKPPVG